MTAKNGNTNGTALATTPESHRDASQPATLPEAPASASAKMTSPNGIEWLLTVRDFTVNGLLAKTKILEDHLLKDGWQPAGHGRNAAPNGHADAGTAPICPDHHTPMRQSTKHGGWFCPQSVGTHPQTGKKLYCTHKVDA